MITSYGNSVQYREASMNKKTAKGNTAVFILGFLLLVVASAAVRIPYLTHYPPQVHNDEAATGIYILELIKSGGWALYGTTWGHPNLNFWISSLPTKLTGETSVWTIRLMCAIGGVFSLIFFGAAVAILSNRRTSLLFLLFAAPFHLHAHYSRTGFIYNHAILSISLTTLLFALVVARPTLIRRVMLGISLGLSILVYPVTQVLPFALLGTAITPYLLTTWNPLRGFWNGIKRARKALPVLLGCILGCGAQIAFWVQYGYESRVRSQFFLLPDPRRHLEGVMGEHASPLAIWWFNIKQTALFFYNGDLAAQYGFFKAPLAPAMAGLAIMGIVIMMIRATKSDRFSIFVLLTSIGTFVGSTLLVEGDFSPHLIVFGLYLPLFCAVGCDFLWSIIRINHPIIVTPIMIGVGAWWALWNFNYYEQNVTRWKQYRVTYILNLPIDTRSVRSLISLSKFPESLGESFYTLVFPNASKHILRPSADDGQVILETATRSGLPALAIVDPEQESVVTAKLKEAQRKVTTFNHPQGAMLFVE